MDDIFKALNDPARRALLDSLRRKDGQTLTELEAQLDMTRFGVMKHLKVLEDAHLVVPVKRGRFKHHYLNALPLQEVIDRWIDPFLAKPAARGLIDMKNKLEGTALMTARPDLVMSTFIACTHDALWDALTTGEMISQYHFASTRVEGDFAPGGTIVYYTPDGGTMLENRVLDIDPKTRIEFEFIPGWIGPDAPASRCVYLVEPSGGGMKLTVEHYDLGPGLEGVNDGWARYLAGLKTFVETGRAHRFFPEGMGA